MKASQTCKWNESKSKSTCFCEGSLEIIVVVVIIVVGPKEIPNLLKQLGMFTKSLKKITRDFKKSLNDLAEEGDLKDIKKSWWGYIRGN